MLKLKGVGVMRWEAIALALFSQAWQVGLRTKVDTPSIALPACLEDRAEIQCHCNCFCGIKQDVGLVAGGGSLLGASAVAGLWCCSGRTRQLEGSPSPRREGHGIVRRPISWFDLGGAVR